MDLSFLWKGFLIGVAVAAPIGPIGILCIRRTLSSGMLYGIITGLAVSLADALYGAVAGFGLTSVSSVLLACQTPLAIAGSVFLAYLGARTLLSRPCENVSDSSHSGLVPCFLSAFVITVASPVTILYFIAVFSNVQLVSSEPSPATGLALVTGVFLGSAAWWFFLSGVVRLFREHLTARRMAWLNRACGVLLIGFAMTSLFSVR